MISTPLPAKDRFGYLGMPNQIGFSENFPVNHALTHVAQTVVETLQHAYPAWAGRSNSTETITIRAIEPEYRQLITVESLTERELEVLQLIVDGHSNPTIARQLYITEGTVKTHVRNILRKLCVNDRTQAAIRALRSGLVH